MECKDHQRQPVTSWGWAQHRPSRAREVLQAVIFEVKVFSGGGGQKEKQGENGLGLVKPYPILLEVPKSVLAK